MRTVRPAPYVLAALVYALAACSSTPKASAALEVVAAENFYGDIASQIGGAAVHVTSILSDPEADPHLFAPGTENGAAVAHAAVVVMSGLGYDSFMDRLIQASPNPKRTVVVVADQIGIAGADANPHVWYDVPKMPAIATGIAVALERALPDKRADFEKNLRTFVDSLAPLNGIVAAIRAKAAGAAVATTEPVPGYLLDAAGLVVKTPPAFAKAIEEGRDPSPQAVSAMRALFDERRVRVLLYNTQATSPITEDLKRLANANHVPVVGVTETLPKGKTFQTWMAAQAQALLAALS
jgi:zinc/manganese transport system substrate-binding protein